ncbi:SIS domain-containing protein [Desulfonatronovibrio magnus]|uniref:SIS domain-containing protein n=1 Tax=Desulfonatronovibrio magnus TaxID=698827 RepID=UPI0018DB6BFC|nr:SIS domain-containing protein [Desulfonatronovibrio magnus]
MKDISISSTGSNLTSWEMFINEYTQRLNKALDHSSISKIPLLCEELLSAWHNNRQVFICGNGGSAGNAIHIANDLLYGAGVKAGAGLRVEALSANMAVITCLANDLGYEDIYSEQLRVKARKKDMLIVLSGSGNSPNVVKALETGNALGMQTFAILGFSGGRCKELAQVPLHFPVDDMQIAEDMQLIIGHMCMQWLCNALCWE